MTNQNTSNAKTVHRAVVEMDTFFKMMEDIRILKDSISYKRSITAGGYEWIEYTSEELLNQARAMALIMNFETMGTNNTLEKIFTLGIKISK